MQLDAINKHFAQLYQTLSMYFRKAFSKGFYPKEFL